jgi:hypothetical protein
MQPLTQINSLVLCKLSSSSGTTSRKHAKATGELEKQSKAEKNAITVTAKLAERRGTSIGRAAALVQDTQRKIRKLALPCTMIEGASYVQAKDVDAVQQIADDATAKLAAIRRDIIADWPQLTAAAATKLGTLTNGLEWPTAEDIASRFTISLTWLGTPAPIAGTAFETVTCETAARVRASSEAAARADLLAGHGAPVRSLIAELAETVKQIQHGKRLRSERFENIRKAADEIAGKNWLELPELDKLVESLRQSVDGVTDAASLTSGDRARAAANIEQARRQAANTLADLGL